MTRRLVGEYPEKPQGAAPIAGRPRMPKYLSPIAKEKWREMLRLLKAQGVLSKADGPALEVYCETYSRWRAMLTEIATEGHMITTTVFGSNGEPVTKRIVHPMIKETAKLENSLRAMLAQLGSTPVTRARAKPAKENPKEAPLPPDSAGALASDVFDALENENQQEENTDEFDSVGAECEGVKEGDDDK